MSIEKELKNRILVLDGAMGTKNEFYNATDLMNAVINENGKLIHFPITGYWLDIGKHDDLEKAQRDISHIDFD